MATNAGDAEIEKSVARAPSPNEKDTVSLEEGKLSASIKDGDEALKFLRREEMGDEIAQVDEKKLVRKIDFMIVPLMWSCYFLQYLDKTLSEWRASGILRKSTACC